MGGGWNYKRLRMLHHNYRNQLEMQLDQLRKKVEKKYPECVGSYKDCPKEITDVNNPPEQCKKCPKYHEWEMSKVKEKRKDSGPKGAYGKRK